MDPLKDVVHGNMAGNGLQGVQNDLALEREAVTRSRRVVLKLAHGTARPWKVAHYSAVLQIRIWSHTDVCP